MLTAAITIIDIGYNYEREIKILEGMGISARFVPLEGTSDTERIIETLNGFDFVLAGPELWNKAALSGVKSLKMIARLGTGVEKIDIEAASELGIAISNTPGANACSVAQHALCYMLDLGLSITKYDRNMRKGLMDRGRGIDLIGKTVGLVGFGNIPRLLAKLLSGFDTQILAFDVQKDEIAAKELGVRYVEMDELIEKSDYISLHVPMNKQTAGMVNMDFLKKMKPTAYLINTSRGGVVNEGDLIEALQHGVIAGAGLDVYETSPVSADNPLIAMENVVHTPYVAFSSELGNTKTMDIAIKSISEFIAGEDVSFLLNPKYKA